MKLDAYGVSLYKKSTLVTNLGELRSQYTYNTVVQLLDSDMVGSEFKLQSRFTFTFGLIPVGKA